MVLTLDTDALQKLTPQQRHLYIEILAAVGCDIGSINKSHLAQEFGISRATLRNWIEVMDKMGLLAPTLTLPQGGGNGYPQDAPLPGGSNSSKAKGEPKLNKATTPSSKGESRSGSRPTPAQVDEYIVDYAMQKALVANFSGEDFCNFYESKGWKIGKNPMKDWKAAVRTWFKNESNRQSGNNTFNNNNTNGNRLGNSAAERSWNKSMVEQACYGAGTTVAGGFGFGGSATVGGGFGTPSADSNLLLTNK